MCLNALTNLAEHAIVISAAHMVINVKVKPAHARELLVEEVGLEDRTRPTPNPEPTADPIAMIEYNGIAFHHYVVRQHPLLITRRAIQHQSSLALTQHQSTFWPAQEPQIHQIL